MAELWFLIVWCTERTWANRSTTVANRGRCSVSRQARLTGRDRLELAADAVGGVGLHVERVEMRRAAELVQEDEVLGAGPAAEPLGPLLGSAGRCQPGDSRRRPPADNPPA